MKPVVFYGASGHGLGHVTRALSIIERLPDYDVHVFTCSWGHDFLLKLGYPFLHRIQGMTIPYRTDGHVSQVRFCGGVLAYWLSGLAQDVSWLMMWARHYQPKLIISDFEPASARAAHQFGRPLVCLDNQHYFCLTEPVGLPRHLRLYAKVSRWASRMLVPRPDCLIVPSFHWDLARRNAEVGVLTNGFLRKSIEEAVVSQGEEILVYVRSNVSDRFLEALTYVPGRFIVYGAASSPTQSRLKDCGYRWTFKDRANDFPAALAGCRCLISTAGNQLLTEARYLGKPTLAVPEAGQYEQEVNAVYAQHLGFARHLPFDQLNQQTVQCWLEHVSSCGPLPSKVLPNGADRAAAVLQSLLERA